MTALFVALEHPDPDVVKSALVELSRDVSPRTVARIGLCLDHPSYEVRRFAAELLGGADDDAAHALVRARPRPRDGPRRSRGALTPRSAPRAFRGASRDDALLGRGDDPAARRRSSGSCATRSAPGWGIQLAQSTRPSLERRLRERLAVVHAKTFADYYQYLSFNPGSAEEWDAVYDLLTTSETYFFREDYQLRAFQDEVLPLLAEQAKARRRLTIWSAGCSTGEEVYTIAILIHETNLFPGWDVRVFGSDISQRCIDIARRGVYGASSFRTTPKERRRAYFIDRADGAHVVERIRAMCHFGQMNLLERDKARLIGRVDAVFCRNVLIYFDPVARRAAIDLFHERMYPGGVLLLGHSESLLNISTAFELLHLKEDLVYRKPKTFAALPPRDGSSGVAVGADVLEMVLGVLAAPPSSPNRPARRCACS